MGEILALALPREKESLDNISVLEYAIAAQGESEILKYHHVPWEGIRITPQLVKNNPICPQLQELYEDTGVLPDEWTLRLKADEAWWDCPRDEDDYTDAEIEAYERYGPPRIEYELDVPQFLDVHREDNWEFFA